MKIAFVIDGVLPYRIALYKRLAELLDVEFLFTEKRGANRLGDDVRYKTFRNYNIFSFRIALGLLPTLVRSNHEIILWGMGGSRGSLRRSIVIYSNAVMCFLASKIKKATFIIWLGGWNMWQKDCWEEKGLTNTIKRIAGPLLERWLLSTAQAIVIYGTRQRDIYISLGIKSEKMFIAPNTSIIDHETIDDGEIDALKRGLGIVGKRVILSVGRLISRKNQDVLIKAFYQIVEEMKDVCLLIIGDGEERTKLEELCKELGIESSVIFLGAIERSKLPPYYFLCDVFVYPASLEPWGLSLNEAMQLGKPVIAAARVGAAYDLVKQGINGFIVPERDIQALSGAIKTLILDDDLARKMGAKSKKIIEQGFTYERMSEGFVQAIEYCSASSKD